MTKAKDSLSLRQMFLHLLLFRLFMPLMVVGLIALIGRAYLEKQNIVNHQNQIVQSMADIVEYHLDHGGRILDAVARTAEVSGIERLPIFMKSTLEAYGYFDTLYYLDKDNRITLMMPSDSRYIGLDMSNFPDFKKNRNKKSLIISHPFISIRTGDPTVYLVRFLSVGGYVVGELNLKLFQKEITKITNRSDKDFVFIVDEKGTLLAHPSSDLVKQQTNLSNLGIFCSILEKKANDFYFDNKNWIIGSSFKVKRTGWVVVDQVKLFTFLGSYAWIIGITFIASIAIWITLVLNLCKQLQLYIITPIEQLSNATNTVTDGVFSQLNFLPSITTTFAELNKLAEDFQFMTNNLQIRETALQESEDRYRGLFDSVPIGIFRATKTGQILDINPSATLILGHRDREELLNVNIMNFLYLSTDKRQEKYMIEKIGNLRNFETQIQRYDGTIIWVQINSHIVYDNREQEDCFEGSMQDITERKYTENKIKQQQELLFKAEKEKREALEKALIMKDEFISLISHEFKTPLNVIYSAIQLIEGIYFNKIPHRVKELAGTIKQNTFRQLRLANNLLDITKLSSGQFKLNMKNIDIVFLTKAIAKSVELYSDQKNINISFESNAASKIISIDEEKYERIILNILSNAIKFTKNGGEINIILNENIKSNFIQIKVRDTGIGIPKDKQELIFEQFGQVDNNLSRQAEGTGIGLSLVKLLVNLLGGTIEVESELGFGSTFIIMLPAKEEVVDDETAIFPDFDNRLVSEIKVEFSDIYL